MSHHVVIVDDEPNIGLSLRLILEREKYRVSIFKSIAEFRARPLRADAWLVDVRLPDGSGIEILKQLRAADPNLPVVMISGQATIAEAVEATRAGAFDFLEKPLSRDKVLLTLQNAVEQRRLRDENARLREMVGSTQMVGASDSWQRTLDQASLAAASDARVLLLGESGTGKELLAAHIHQTSPFASGPFVKVNCAAIPADLLESELFGYEKGAFTGAAQMRRGKFELADGGTLFLDEVGDLSPAAQAKLLRVLQEGEVHRLGSEEVIRVNVRVVAATNRDLEQMAANGGFRQDLYYRLCVVPIRVPPLRERRDDIPALVNYFLEEFCRRNNFRGKMIDNEVLEALQAYHWPGNARELRNVVERMAILTRGDLIAVEAIPWELRNVRPTPSSLHDTRANAERDHIRRALEEHNWNISAAARALGLERTNLHKRLRALGVARVK
ncbi:MAG: sigma-54-dependent Fis family transcriptional regulator [Bryobacterales bacterium]|nr:sigma-54-dependent Fis family transcriptional regulator [Bryobacterales bacterium]